MTNEELLALIQAGDRNKHPNCGPKSGLWH